MKRFAAMLLICIMMSALCACGAEVPEAAPTPAAASPVPTETAAPAETREPEPAAVGESPAPSAEEAVPELPPVWDESLNTVLEAVTWDVRPGSSGCSLRAIQCAAALLDWGTETALSDDEIYSAVGCYIDTLDSEGLSLYLESILTVYDAVYTLWDGDTKALLEEAGVTGSACPWNERAFRAVEMVSYGGGMR